MTYRLFHVLAAGLIALAASSALAHSPLNTSSPANGATISAMPQALALEFKGDIRLTRVTAVHATGDKADLDLGSQKSFADAFSVPLTDMGPGVYTIEWRGLGSDGHAMSGQFEFTVD